MMTPWNRKQLTTSLSEPAPAWSVLNRRLFNPNALLEGRYMDDAHSLEVFRQLEDIPLDVQSLFAKAEQSNIEFGLCWYRNLVSTVFDSHDGLRIYVLRKNGQPIAALPVLSRRTSLGQRVVSLSNYYTPIYTIVTEPGVTAHDLVPLLKTVRDSHPGLKSLQLSPMDPDSAAYRALQSALDTAGLPSFRFFCFGNWYLPVTSDWPTYLKNREGKLRSTIKRMGKSFAAAGGTLELVLDGPSLERGLKAYEDVYAASWKQAEPYPQFIPGLVRTCATRGWLRLGIAWLNGEAIAAQIWIVANDKANIYKLAYDQKYKAYASGTLLTAMLMQHVFETDHVREVDYLMGDDAYKKSWMSHRRERWGLVAYNPKTVGGMLGLTQEALARTLKRSIHHVKSHMQTLTTKNVPAALLTESDRTGND